MTNKRILTISRKIHTPIENVAHWLDYYQVEFPILDWIPTNLLVFMKEIPASHKERRIYYIMAGEPSRHTKISPYNPDNWPEDSSSIDPRDTVLGLIRVDKLSENLVEFFCWRDDEENIKFFNDRLFRDLTMNFLPDDPYEAMIEEDTNPAEEPPSISEKPRANPWERIPDNSWDRIAVQMWHEGNTNREIAKQVRVTKERVTNRLSELRTQYGKEVVPTDEQRRKKLIEKARDMT